MNMQSHFSSHCCMNLLLMLWCLLLNDGFLRAVNADTAVLVAGGGINNDGSQAVTAKLYQPFAIAFTADDEMLFVEFTGGERLRRVARDGIVTTLGGTGHKGFSGDDGPALSATFNALHDLAIGNDGKIYLADTFNHCIRVFDPKNGTVSGFAGGTKGFSGDGGPARSAQFDQAYSIAFSSDHSTLYVVDLGNSRLRGIDMKSGIIKTVAGNGARGVPLDGKLAVNQPLVDLRAVTVASDGTLYLLERAGNALRIVKPDGTMHRVAGTGKAGSEGNGGPALNAAFNGPKYVSMSKDGSVLIVDTENHQIRRYVPHKQIVELVVGSGIQGTAGIGGDPLTLQLARPHGAFEHPQTGDLYIADSDNHRIVKIVRD